MTNQPLRVPPPIPVIEMPPDLRLAYSNTVRISHTPSEMVLDFALKLPGDEAITVTARVLMSPLSAKLFQAALADNVGKYESAFGPIKMPGQDALSEYSKLFRPPAPPGEGEGKGGSQ